ncbi:protein kinase [Rhodococcus pseudokoreensis]|uniref:Protein kinase n=1 Tax=Rhodococcus pseudokoreensis TaxID=2811421 RepID=A0A974W4C8_9NOCA|nr:protein kinase [Rhodococcus pseudokoreensis]QSE90769.1 protein kinase [Rhodococcus pseudokoreensis]
MTDSDPFRTQRDVTTAAELGAVGFDEAEEIGRGGFGVVYRCTQSVLERMVAVKVLTAELDEENRERFFREQRAMGRLTGHPNIAGALQVGSTNSGRPYLVMPYYRQGSLDARIRRHGPLTREEVLRLGVKMAAAVETAHRAGILHRDVKPANIVLTDFGEPVLTDFGIAHIVGGFTTATGTVSGSPAFTAPEVLGGDPPSPAADVYGLGATLFAALTGHAAFERRSGEQVVAQFLRITAQPVPDLREHGVDDEVAAVIEHAMARTPDARPSAVVLGERLQQLQARSGFPVDEMALRAEPTAEEQTGGAAAPVPLTTGRPASSIGGSSGGGGNLPAELTTFVGRRTELTEAKQLLASSRLVTLIGIGGVGKTRLALRIAANARRVFTDGVWLVELGELGDGALLADVIAAALGLRPHSTRPVPEVLMDFLASREVLLVLDNCEQVVDAAAQLAETLLRACPGLRILATSREALTVGGEAVLRVPPLRVPVPEASSMDGLPSYDGVRLFVERASSALPGFELTENNAASVAGICARVEGLPLAIELAAARLRALSPEQILARLTDRFKLLARSSRGAPTRQQTLLLCIDWSYELCTRPEQQLWAQLSVFAGPFELDAAEQVCRCDIEADGLLDVLASLVDKSILIREESGTAVRFRMLETLRDFGRERVRESDELPELRRRHLRWYRQLALDVETGWISARQLDWIDRLDREQPNLREALEFALTDDGGSDSAVAFAAALQPFWVSRGQLGEGRHWIDRTLAAAPGAAPAVRAKALYRDVALADSQGDRAAAEALVVEARALAERTADPLAHAFVEFTEGLHDIYVGDLAPASARLERTRDIFAARGDLLAQVLVLLTLGWARELKQDTAGALECYEKILAITESHGESVWRSYALWSAAVAVWHQGERDQALDLLQQALVLVRRRRDPFVTATCLEVMAWFTAAEGDARRAAVLMGAAQALHQVTGATTVVFPNLLVHHDECERTTRRALGPRVFEAAHNEGRSLDLDAAIAYALGEEPTTTPPTAGPSTELTRREREVADLVAEGLTNRAIAARLVISPRTAAGHVEHVLTKLGFTSRAQIAAWVVEHRSP